MKSLYPKGKGKIHPSPSCPGASPGGGAVDALAVLTLLPAAIVTLTAALRAEDREVLAYLVTRSLQGPWHGADEERQRRCWRLGHHRPLFCCGCFDCYISYWCRWDSSPDRELIHQAIEAFEEHLASSERRPPPGGRSGRRRDWRSGDRSGKAKLEERSRDNKRKKEKKGKKEKASPGRADDEGPSSVASSCIEEDEEKIYYAELVLEKEVGCGGDDAGGGSGEGERGMEIVAVSGGERRGWADVIGLFNSRFWSLWSPGV